MQEYSANGEMELWEALAKLFDFAHRLTGGGMINEQKYFLARINLFMQGLGNEPALEILDALANLYDFTYSISGGGTINEEKDLLLQTRRLIESSADGSILLAESDWREWDNN